MNERIKELAEQAKIKVWHNGGGLLSDKAFEIVTELIVQEMCNVLDREQWNIGRDWICDDGTRIIPKVKEHFGVE